MPRATKCLALVKGRAMRLTRIDGCGRPVYGEYSSVVSDGWASVAFTANTTETDEISIPNASGKIKIFEASVTSLQGYTIEISFLEVDPDLFSMLTGMPVVLNADGDVIGLDIDVDVNIENVGFALEVWAGSQAADACDEDAAEGSFGYMLLPFLKGGVLGDFTVENGNVSFTISNASTRKGNAWGVGPYADIMIGAGSVPGPMLTPVSSTTAFRLMLTDVAPPEPVCGARPLLDPSLPSLTSLAGAEGDTDMEVEFTTTPAATGPVYYDFGDGTWDYVAAPGATAHTYTVAGTYVVRASQDGVFVEEEVVVPFP